MLRPFMLAAQRRYARARRSKSYTPGAARAGARLV